jgi:Cu-processing system ATP-binding protein
MLDEPTAGLDPLASEILKDKIIAESRQGKLVLITSHLLTELDELVTHVVLMQDGKIGFHLPVAELKTKTQTPNLSRAITQVLRHGHV